MSYKKLEKHNIIDIVRRNELLEFKKEDLIKLCEYSSYRDWYSTSHIENMLQELVSEGKLDVYYISVKVEPLKSYIYADRFVASIDYKVGSKSVAIYKLVIIK
jgi:hypothetical protein